MSIKDRLEPTAPGCHGFAIAFNPSVPTCRDCSFSKSCQPVAYKNLMAASKEVEVGDISRLHSEFGSGYIKSEEKERFGSKLIKRLELTQEQQEIVDQMPSRSATIARGIYTKIGDPKPSLAKGVNPFAGVKPGYLEPLADLLLAGGCTKGEYKVHLSRVSSGWTLGTLDTRVSTATKLFVGMGIVEFIDGVMRLKI